jgi:carboxypeptidase C (cathepsin A)
MEKSMIQVVLGAMIGLFCLGLCPKAAGQMISSESYSANADTLPIGENSEKPSAEIFFIAYTLDGEDPATRPLSFVFNGGPGASSVYLHLGALGPRTLEVPGDGSFPEPPGRLQKNISSWLAFTDLVFVDPVGTGYSRPLGADKASNPEQGSEQEVQGARAEPGQSVSEGNTKAFLGAENDLKSLGQFIRLYLTRFGRWTSPKALVGESYGGRRFAALSRSLMEDLPWRTYVLLPP